MDGDAKRAIALWRLGVLGPLVSARLEHGERRAYFEEASRRMHRRPDGRVVTLSARTVERWFYGYLHGGFEALYPEGRSDRGRSRAIRPEVAELVLRAKREKPRRSIRRIIRMLERARTVRAGELSRSSVHRLLVAHGVSSRPLRGPPAERRSFLHEHAGDLWVGDALHGPVCVALDGKLRKAYLLSQIDGATRYVPHSYFALSEGAAAQEHGLEQALLKHGRPRTYYVDLGSAYIARSLVEICAELVGREVELRFDPTDPDALPTVFVDERFVCDTVLLDRLRNVSRRRRRNLGEPAPGAEPSGLDPLALIEREHYERVRPVGGPAHCDLPPDPHDPDQEG